MEAQAPYGSLADRFAEHVDGEHDDEVRKLQGQIADLASVIQSERPGSHVDIHSGNDAHNLQKGLMECVEKMRLQQQEEKKSMISLFQRHCQVLCGCATRVSEAAGAMPR